MSGTLSPKRLGACSYDSEPPGRGFDGELARLRAQAELSWDIERRRLQALGVADGQRLLELGCGPGFITRKLAEWLPHSTIVALDTDAHMLRVARETLGEPETDSRVQFLQGSADATALGSNEFDVAISRYLFQHLPNPAPVASEVLRVIRPRGAHIIIDIDDGLWGLAEPRFESFGDWHARRARAQAWRGGNRFLGRHLGRILREAGYNRVELDLFGYDSDELGLQAFDVHLAPVQFVPLLEAGAMSLAEYAHANALYEQFVASPDAFVMMVGFIVRGEKPDADAKPTGTPSAQAALLGGATWAGGCGSARGRRDPRLASPGPGLDRALA